MIEISDMDSVGETIYDNVKRRSKELRRKYNIAKITDDFSFDSKLSNIVKYDGEDIIRRRKILGLSIGRKYKVDELHKTQFYKLVEKITDSYDVIITGSTALRIHGLLNREVGDDLDIIVSKEVKEEMNKHFKISNVYSGYNTRSNYSVTYKVNGYKVDVFIEDDSKYEIIDNVKVHNPFDLIDFKINFLRNKDIDDCNYFIKLLESKLV